MRKTARHAYLAAALLLVLSGWFIASAQVRRVSIEGRLIDTDGNRLQGDVAVIERGADISVSSYETDSQGTFSFQALAGQLITVVAKADGYISSERMINVGSGPQNIEFVLSSSGRVAGRVIDENGRPVPDAVVRIRYPNRSRSHEFGQEVGEVVTDDYGYFTLPFVERRTPFVLDVAAPSRPSTSSLPTTLAGESLNGILLTVTGKTQPVRGKVLDATNQPVTGANVHLRLTGKNASNASLTSMLQANRFTTTANDGSFLFPDVGEGDVVLVARHGSSRPATVESTVTNSAPLEVTLILR